MNRYRIEYRTRSLGPRASLVVKAETEHDALMLALDKGVAHIEQVDDVELLAPTIPVRVLPDFDDEYDAIAHEYETVDVLDDEQDPPHAFAALEGQGCYCASRYYGGDCAHTAPEIDETAR